MLLEDQRLCIYTHLLQDQKGQTREFFYKLFVSWQSWYACEAALAPQQTKLSTETDTNEILWYSISTT